MMESVVCPKCHHVRQPEESGSLEQCPRCGIIYAKFDPSVDQRREALRKISERRLHRAAVAESARVNAREAAILKANEAARMDSAMAAAAEKGGATWRSSLTVVASIGVSLLGVAAAMGFLMRETSTTQGAPEFAVISVARSAVLERLKDPESAIFRNERRGSLGVCGEVNSRNAFGGYTGYQRYIASSGLAFFEREMEPAEFAKSWSAAC